MSDFFLNKLVKHESMKEEWRRDKYEEGERRMERKRRNNHNGWDGRNGTMEQKEYNEDVNDKCGDCCAICDQDNLMGHCDSCKLPVESLGREWRNKEEEDTSDEEKKK